MSTREKKRFTARQKLLILTASGLLAAALIVCGLLLLRADDAPELYIPPRYTGSFAEADFSEDISLDTEYLAYDRAIRYVDGNEQNGITVKLSDANVIGYGNEVVFLYNMIQTIIAGDHAAYNAMLSAHYLKYIGEVPAFTPQKLYDIRIIPADYELTRQDEVLLCYRVEYRIKDNNGTFRFDIGSDVSREVLYVLKSTGDAAAPYVIYEMRY